MASTILGIAALFWGFVQAPFLHIHVEETDHSAASLAHQHVHAVQSASGPAICAHTPDDDAIDVEWRIGLPQTVALAIDLAISDSVIIEPPPVVSAAVSILRPRGHDPPDLTPKQPRSPPA
jgi:hypothetical protein